MIELRNILTCTFERDSPRITALEIHEWIYEKMQIPDSDVLMIRIDGKKRLVYVKVRTHEIVENIITRTKGLLPYAHKEGIISTVKLGIAGLGSRRVRTANLPPEMPRGMIQRALETYRKIGDIKDEMWAQTYHYKVTNGVLLANIELKQHIPSHIDIGGYRALVSYEGQLTTCYACNEIGHLIQNSPKRLRTQDRVNRLKTETWAMMIAREEGTTMDTGESTHISQGNPQYWEHAEDKGEKRKEKHSEVSPVACTERNDIEQHPTGLKTDQHHGSASHITQDTDLKVCRSFGHPCIPMLITPLAMLTHHPFRSFPPSPTNGFSG